jgi:hypothetical protein
MALLFLLAALCPVQKEIRLADVVGGNPSRSGTGERLDRSHSSRSMNTQTRYF